MVWKFSILTLKLLNILKVFLKEDGKLKDSEIIRIKNVELPQYYFIWACLYSAISTSVLVRF